MQTNAKNNACIILEDKSSGMTLLLYLGCAHRPPPPNPPTHRPTDPPTHRPTVPPTRRTTGTTSCMFLCKYGANDFDSPFAFRVCVGTCSPCTSQVGTTMVSPPPHTTHPHHTPTPHTDTTHRVCRGGCKHSSICARPPCTYPAVACIVRRAIPL